MGKFIGRDPGTFPCHAVHAKPLSCARTAQRTSFYPARQIDQKRQTHRGLKKKVNWSSAQSKKAPMTL